jgi:hypothetical protein
MWKSNNSFYNKCSFVWRGGQALQEIVVTGSRTPVEVIQKSFTNRQYPHLVLQDKLLSTKLYNTEYLHLVPYKLR